MTLDILSLFLGPYSRIRSDDNHVVNFGQLTAQKGRRRRTDKMTTRALTLKSPCVVTLPVLRLCPLFAVSWSKMNYRQLAQISVFVYAVNHRGDVAPPRGICGNSHGNLPMVVLPITS